MKKFGDKQPAEKYYLGFDFANDLEDEILSSAAVTIADLVAGTDVTTAMIDATKQQLDGTIVYFWVKAGTAGGHYKITCRATGTAGSLYEIDARLDVVD